MRSGQLSLFLALVAALLPAQARAQSAFSQPYNYTDADGPGVMTITPLSNASTAYTYQQIQVSLTQGSERFSGSGVYHDFADDSPSLQPYTLLSFTLFDSRGTAWFFQGRVSPGPGKVGGTGSVSYDGGGTYWQVSFPQSQYQWQISQQDSGPPPTSAVTNDAPALQNYWNRVTSPDSVGGSFYATYNSAQGTSSTATWSGNLPSAGTYRIEVFIPRQGAPAYPPRTSAATYVVYDSGGRALTYRLSHQANSSQWFPLATVSLGTTYRVILYDQTGEPTGSRSVVADAVRLTPQ
jgi:hypothetical protein